MSVVFLLIPLCLLFASLFLAAFIWAVRSGQYDDTETPSMRLLMEEDPCLNSPHSDSSRKIEPPL
jgi:cbb3-type cytochrome oxidase maturation protein